MNDSFHDIRNYCLQHQTVLLAVSKTKSPQEILRIYEQGQRAFGENKVQELVEKYKVLPEDIQWHLIGHLQSNKVKQIAPFVSLIHSVDSLNLLREIDRQGRKYGHIIRVLLQIHIAKEETKFGLSFDEARTIIESEELQQLEHVAVCGLMGMATFTDDESAVRNEFRLLKRFFDACAQSKTSQCRLSILSMGMSGDYRIAIEEGSTMVRIGSAIFGARN